MLFTPILTSDCASGNNGNKMQIMLSDAENPNEDIQIDDGELQNHDDTTVPN